MSFKKVYKSKFVTPEEAVKNIKSGDRVVIGHACAEPSTLVDALIANKERYKDVEIVHMLPMGKSEYVKSEMKPHFHHNAIFVGPSTREAVENGRADYTPCFFYEVPSLFKEGHLPVDVALISVSKPDRHGCCSFGISNDYTKPAAECAKIVIAEINDQMPRTFGDSFIHISDIDYIVETSRPLIELQPPSIGQVEKKIGEYCASLIDDGSTIQLGLGAIPDAVTLSLMVKKDLGIHSEMISDGIIDLMEAGVVTNRKKTINKGKIVTTLVMGSNRLYDFVDNNPLIETYSVNYTNNPAVIAKHRKMVSINSCLQVDFMGQVVADTIGFKQYSGVGGQVDFVRGASMSEGGKSIMAMPSTAVSGKVSRIVPVLDRGAAVTTSRNDVNYIVTEYGIAQLKGKSLKERGKSLIKVAHPKFRDQLIDEWEKRFKTKF